jgi:hypothetical protein
LYEFHSVDTFFSATMQLGRQDVADKKYLPASEVKAYTPKRSGKELGVLFAKEGGVSVFLCIAAICSATM